MKLKEKSSSKLLIHLHTPRILHNYALEIPSTSMEPSQPVISFKTQFWSRSISLLTLDVIQNFLTHFTAIDIASIGKAIENRYIFHCSKQVNRIRRVVESIYHLQLLDLHWFSCGFVMKGLGRLLCLIALACFLEEFKTIHCERGQNSARMNNSFLWVQQLKPTLLSCAADLCCWLEFWRKKQLEIDADEANKKEQKI
jgi:hypothetical protein